MSDRQGLPFEGLQHGTDARDREITPNELFWLEVIRLASWVSDPAPTLERVQKLRMIFQLSLKSPP